MGEAKRRRELLDKDYGKQSNIFWTKANRDKLVRWTIEGLLISVVSLVVLWITFRFLPN